MLVISRKIGQRLFIGESIVLTVLKVTGKRVRLGIEAPQKTRVLREEIELSLSEKKPGETMGGAG